MTGPQAKQIEIKLENNSKNDGNLIKMAIEETISGAIEAPQKTKGRIVKRYSRGSHRGNGL